MLRILLVIVIPLITLFLPQKILKAQAPANDPVCGALLLTVGSGCVNSSNVSATSEGMAIPSCWSGNPSNYSNSVWYYFVATDDSITVNIGDGPTNPLSTKTLTAVYSSSNNSCTGTLTEIGCAKSGNETDLTGLIIGNSYFIMIDGSGTNTGDFCVSVYETPPPPPPIGTCSNPRDLFPAGDCSNISGTQYDEQNNILKTDLTTGGDGGASASGFGNPTGHEGGCPDIDAGQNAYWIRFTATVTSGGAASSKTYIDNAGSVSLDYAIYRSPICISTTCISCPTSCSNLVYLNCYTIAAGGNQEITVQKDSVYYVMITNTSPNTSNTRFLCLRSGTIYNPPNNTCGTAIVATAGVEYTASNSNATVDGSLCSGSTENNVWFKWTVPGSWSGQAYVHLYNQDCACGNGLQMSIYNSSITCTPSGNQTGNCQIVLNPNNDNDFYGNFTPTPGATYLINIDGYAGCACEFNFKVLGTSILVPGVLTVNAGPDNSICSGNSDTLGSTFTALGGSGNYSYLWSPSTGLNNATIANPITTSSSTTTYFLTVTDNITGCIKSDTAIVTINACGGCALTATAAGTNLLCNGVCNGEASSTPSGGTSPYTYKWTNGSTTQNLNSICSGAYTITVTDANGCKANASVTITQPTALTVSVTNSNLLCNGVCAGEATGTGASGTSPYTYQWASGQTTQTISSLCAGTYILTVKDANNCRTTKSVVITQPDLLVMALSKTNAVCNCPCPGKAFVTNITGGTRQYTFLWSTGATTLVITDLCPGTYSVAATDANGCTVSGSVTLP